MNYNGAEGLEFGAGNVHVDPSVLAGKWRPDQRLNDADHTKYCQQVAKSPQLRLMVSVSGPTQVDWILS